MNNINPSITQSETTDRYIVLLREDRLEEGIQTLYDSTGIRQVVRASDFADHAVRADQLERTDAVVFDKLGAAITPLSPDQRQSINAAIAEQGSIIAIEPENVVYALADIELGRARQQKVSRDRTDNFGGYLRGYRDAVNHLVDNLLSTEKTIEAVQAEFDETEATWGLQATKVLNSSYSGRGIKVAVLDTGLDFSHPDFEERQITSKSFVDQEEAQDKLGHGTHVIGTACGSRSPSTPPRYGVAHEAEIYAGKVLSNQGRGSDRQILSGIEWAINNDCAIVSMSLGGPAQIFYSRVFENIARRALRNQTLIIAAAGNGSDRREGQVEPVGHPANCPSIMAVAALDRQLEVAFFSNGGLYPWGGQIDVAGPGVDVYSSYPTPTQYKRLKGTSMATPHVSGIAALYAEATKARGQELWNLLTQQARRLSQPSTDVGSGLVQAPTNAG